MEEDVGVKHGVVTMDFRSSFRCGVLELQHSGAGWRLVKITIRGALTLGGGRSQVGDASAWPIAESST